MKNLHRRVVEFTFFTGDLPMFETDQQAQEWYAAVGRLVTYPLYSRSAVEHDTVDLVQVQVRDKDEMVAWWRILNKKGWGVSHWPKEYGGRGSSPIERVIPSASTAKQQRNKGT